MVGRRNKVLAAAALWGACAWFLSLDADLLTTPDEDLIRQLHRAIRHIEQVLKRYDPEAADLGGKLKKPSVRETQASLYESEQSGNSNADAKRASPRY